ncbi:hypothetical protein O3P69_020733 [Scylla paramamosain]|uniref:Uncharacterized protein n=1 Tax=Scylla paramamosain TaxID=85552 RepID=A0AAW0TMG7_SCYPA
MSSGRKGDGESSSSYSTTDTTRKNRSRFRLRRMNSFDCSYEDIEVREERSPRELSVEGRLRARHFHSSSSSSASLLPGQKCLRFSDECWSSASQSPSPRHTGAKTRRSGRSLSLAERRQQLCSSTSLPQSTDTDCTPSTTSPSSTSTSTSTNVSLERRRRRSQFRRAWSLFSLTCDKEVERERREKSQQKILRPPTRHYYRRGASGLPIECSSTYLGLAY